MAPKSKSKHSIKSIFYDVQFSKSNHPTSKKILTDIYKKADFDQFVKEFISCVKVCIGHEEKSLNVERTLDFAATFAVSFVLEMGPEESCPLLESMFQFIFDNHDCNTPLVRLRICQLMNRLLDNMGHDATVLEETYDNIAENMLVRLQDSMSSVRTQAVYALHRLQTPNEPKCDIIEAFKFHLTHDPSHEVRRAVIQKIAVNKVTLASILTRMHDVKDLVRKEAYTIINRFLIRQFTIKQRQLILESGLKDRSEMTRDYVLSVLVPNWLKYFEYNYYDFLECIHVEKIPETGIKLLKAHFEKQHDVILESMVKSMLIINQRIEYSKLNILRVIYWRALAEHVRPTDENDKYEEIFQQVMPDLTPFCQYIRDYFFPTKVESDDSVIPPVLEEDQSLNNTSAQEDTTAATSSNKTPEGSKPDGEDQSLNNTSAQEETTAATSSNKTPEGNKPDGSKESSPNLINNEQSKPGTHKPSEAVLVHLLEMCKVYDLSDEMGRASLKQLCVDFLQNPAVTLKTVPVLASLLDHVIADVRTKLSTMAEIITELREPLQANETHVYVPDLLLQEAEDKKAELGEKIVELAAEMEIAQELCDEIRVVEIKTMQTKVKEELRIMNSVAPQEPGRNVNDDPDTLKKCLTIVVEIMKKGRITKMDPTLYSLMQNFIMVTLKYQSNVDGAATIMNLALQALGVFCVLDLELAKEHFMMFCFNIANEILSVTALKCVFDLLHVFGLATFNIEDPDEANATTDSSLNESTRKPNLVVLLMSLLNSESLDIRRTAGVGLCKLLVAGRIKSAELVTKLIVLWYSPSVDSDPHIRQPLGVFFRLFGSSCQHAPPILVKAFMPTLKEFFKMEQQNQLIESQAESVANLMIDLTRPNYNLHTSKDQCLHNEVAINICEEVLSEELDSIQCAVLVKILGQLELNYSLTSDMNMLSTLVSRMIKSIPKGDKNLARMALKFEMSLQAQMDNNKTVSTVENTLPVETSTITTSDIVSRYSSGRLLVPMRLSSNSNSEEDEDGSENEGELSQLLVTTRDAKSEGDVIISESDSSELEEEEQHRPQRAKTAKLSPESQKGFKQPAAPREAPFKVPTKTPRKTTATPAKARVLSPQKSTNTSLEPSSARLKSKTPAKSTTVSTKTPAKTTTKTPGKQPPRTPAKTTRSAITTPAKASSSPEQSEPSTSERVTRSARKRKS